MRFFSQILALNIILYLFIPFVSAQNFSKTNPAAASISNEGLARYESFLEDEIKNRKIAGAVSLVVRKGEVAHYKALGYNSLGDVSPMTTDKIFFIQSMTKPIVSIAFMTLYEEGRFNLNDPVSKFIPAFNDLKVIQVKANEVEYVNPERPVLIWHLLSHTAGFSHGLGDNEYDTNLRKILYESEHKTLEERVSALLAYPLMGHPGNQWNYSASPDVLGLLIEKISGQSLAVFLKERIFEPLGMKDTGYNVHKEEQSRVAGLHQSESDGTVKAIDAWAPAEGNTLFGGTHGLYSTAEDYMKFSLMLLNNGSHNGKRIISRKTLELMTANHIEGLIYSPGNGFGLGFGVLKNLAKNKASGSEGSFYWSGAFNTYFVVDPAEDLVAILMAQHWPYTNFYAEKMRQFVYSAIID